MSLHDAVRLGSPGTSMPPIGFGVYQIHANNCTSACLSALDVGYRHIDSAQLYRNEAQVGQAIPKSGLNREDVFLTTKMGVAKGSHERTYQSALESVQKLDGENGYVDLFLIHIPGRTRQARQEIWGALERLYKEGRTKSIGLHPWCQQRDLVEYCRREAITIQAYSPLVQGTKFNDTTLQEIAIKHGKTPAQVLIRYSLQKRWIPLPRSEKPSRMRENVGVFGFELDEQDMEALDGLDQGPDGARFPKNVDRR